ncbi:MULTISPECIES: DUF6279 family lipoprotein [unclassified Colwellia]|jgi:hypothetical protein|uniref:DUF6279 family lipoprotein n=1 Tax=unclassified Colwellia TaxID=196834 RepID=UPI0015F4799E|nr:MULTISPECIES: DUF6279 family lipoprotein [unclassified Colwellia]MBA6231922.1 hypothetical protein [Colwellia sp. MB02u-7]MBA6235905.1 hypothetical protein [Colwellia sp. MB02u-11]MBA6255259.1 hypothetical protein [Colwellia sp. MB3u-28]MBA6258576.1 hypothetical protein [Colwellia sp. MB3u-41]MBA6298680.1 hypothetical protein [Colwellia sp. MB3u-22]
MPRIIKNGFLVIFSSFLLTACSFSFIYNHLDWWSDWYLNDYVTLNQEQQQLFDTTFNELHFWHRQTQLREYTLQFRTLKEQVNRGITDIEVSEHLAQVKNHWVTVRERAKPKLIVLVSTLDSIQRKQVIDEIARKNKDRDDDQEQLIKEQWFKEQCKERQEQLKKWVGKLTPDQKLEVCELMQAFLPTFNHRMDYRKKWLSGLKQVLSIDLNKQQYEVMFTELISNPDTLKSEEYRMLSKNNMETSVRVFHYLMNDLTDRQRKILNGKLDDFIEDLTTLEMDF